jgi:cation:H+ antiporter
MSIVWLLLGFVLLVVGGEFLVRAAVGLSFKLNISKVIIGMTVVSFATSAPELLVSLQAALNGSPAIAINNVIGSNIANIGLVLGITALIGTIGVGKDFLKINWTAMLVFSMAIFYLLSNDGILDSSEGAGLFIALLIFLVVLIKKTKNKPEENEDIDANLTNTTSVKIFIWLAIGAVALYFGSEWLVKGAVVLAKSLGVSEGVISVTMIAIGTSVPELAASVIAALKQEKAISLGNLVGSNIFNIGSVLGLTAIIKPIAVTEPQILSSDIYWMLGFALVLLPLVFLPKKWQISRYKGLLLVIGYATFIYYVFSR